MSDGDHMAWQAPGSPPAVKATGASGPETGFGLWLDRSLDRLGLRGPTSRDTALAVLVAAVTTAILWSLFLSMTHMVAVRLPLVTELALTGVVVVQALALSVRRRYPTGCLMAAVALQVLLVALAPPEVGIEGPALMIATYTCGTRLAPLRLVVVLVTAALMLGSARGFASVSAGAGVSAPRVSSRAWSRTAWIGSATLCSTSMSAAPTRTGFEPGGWPPLSTAGSPGTVPNVTPEKRSESRSSG